MSGSIIEQAAKDVREADLVLVGIGEELDMRKLLEADERYTELSKSLEEKQLLPYIEKVMLSKIGQEHAEVYRNLAKCLKDKNYFIITLCQDGMISEAGLNKERIVETCGAYRKLQCEDGCGKELYEVSDRILGRAQRYLESGMPENADSDELPVCIHCGKPLVFNHVQAAHYVEEGYLDQWGIYQKWLQGSLNKKLCILELGVGMKYPTVIRWPFEKIVFFNLKSKLYRIHSKLYHTAEEIKERSCGICQKPEEFLKELSNGF